MAALIRVERRLAGFPTGIPNGSVVVDVEVASTIVHGYSVVSVAGDAAELGILVEVVTAGRIADQTEEVFM